MKKMSVLNATTLFLVVIFLSASVFQCKKEGDIIKGLDRSFKGKADSSLYAAFYDTNRISTADVVPDVNDQIVFRGVQKIIHEYCATSNCHNGPIGPKLNTYTDIMQLVTAGNPEGSKIWEFLTTNDFDRAMPPVNSNHEMNSTDKAKVYNWIKNGAKERPDLADFKPAAISLIVTGCGSANCHSQQTATGAWARGKLLGNVVLAPGVDTTEWISTDQVTGAKTSRCLLVNKSRLDTVWGIDTYDPNKIISYKDSVKKFYSDTTVTTYKPTLVFSTRGPLNTYDDIIMDIKYPKSIRSTTVRNNWLNSNDNFIRRLDSSLIYHNAYTGVAQSVNGSMAYDDGGCSPSEVALIKAWYFADPNIPDVWKYGNNNVGIFKYRKSGKFIKK